ncbi:MAG: uroporphyrinogen decarboxylase family protein, partial [Nitrososphaeria archaeon]
RTDMAEAKKKVGDWVCISGNVPPAILMHGSPQEVKDYCKRLIDTCAAGGGFILSPASTLDEARPENIKAMIEICREYKG